MSLRAFQPSTPYSSLKIVVGQTMKPGEFKVIQQFTEVNQVTKRSKKQERSTAVKEMSSSKSTKDYQEYSSKVKLLKFISKAENNMTTNDSITGTVNSSNTGTINVSNTRTDNVSIIGTVNASNNGAIVPQSVNITSVNITSPSRQKRASGSPNSGPRDLPFDPDELEGYDWTGTQLYYITGELPAEVLEEGILFVLGDGKYYGR